MSLKTTTTNNSFCGFCGICSWSSLLSCYSQCKSKQPTPHQTLLIADIYTSITYTVLNKYNRRQRGKHDTGWANNNTVRPHLPLTLPPPVQVRGSNKDMYAPEPHSMRMSPTAYTVHGLYTYIYIYISWPRSISLTKQEIPLLITRMICTIYSKNNI